MAMLRNINNFMKYNISGAAKDVAVKKLTDVEEVKKSKQLPFRFSTAYKNVKGDRQYSDAISEAMDIAVSNVPELNGSILIAVDTSGSMSGDPIEKASIFAATLLKANKSADLILYDTRVQEASISGRGTVIDIANEIQRMARGGGTETSLVFTHCMLKNKHYDRIIIISDNESWNERSWGSNVQAEYAKYKQTGADPFIYAIDIEGYGTKDVDGKKVFHLTGWSDRLLDFIGQAEKGEALVDYVRNYEKINY